MNFAKVFNLGKVQITSKKNPTWFTQDLKILMGYLAEGKIKPVIARQMPLVEARQAQELILGAKVKGKIVLICH